MTPYITCRELIEFLGEYAADSLEPARRHEFDRHLSVCPSCVAYLDSYRETTKMAKAAMVDIEDVPPEVLTAILATITRGK
jgi:anti-sigma factor RsiW